MTNVITLQFCNQQSIVIFAMLKRDY